MRVMKCMDRQKTKRGMKMCSEISTMFKTILKLFICLFMVANVMALESTEIQDKYKLKWEKIERANGEYQWVAQSNPVEGIKTSSIIMYSGKPNDISMFETIVFFENDAKFIIVFFPIFYSLNIVYPDNKKAFQWLTKCVAKNKNKSKWTEMKNLNDGRKITLSMAARNSIIPSSISLMIQDQ